MPSRIILFSRSLLLFTGMVTLILFYAFVLFALTASGASPQRRRLLAASCGRRCLRWFRVSAGLDYTIDGREHLRVIEEGPTILFWRHESAWETFLSLVLVPEPTWVLKHELLWVPIMGWGIHLIDPIAIDRSTGRKAVARVLEIGRRQLAAGRVLNLFPEGTRLAPGARRRYGLSGALLALSTGAKIVPIAHDSGTYWPRRGFLKRPGRIRVLIGPPIAVAQGESAEAVNDRVSGWMESALTSLRPSRA
jgi:1-acyl-sn-glycerol-3-phosphate acyltransferase